MKLEVCKTLSFLNTLASMLVRADPCQPIIWALFSPENTLKSKQIN